MRISTDALCHSNGHPFVVFSSISQFCVYQYCNVTTRIWALLTGNSFVFTFIIETEYWLQNLLSPITLCYVICDFSILVTLEFIRRHSNRPYWFWHRKQANWSNLSIAILIIGNILFSRIILFSLKEVLRFPRLSAYVKILKMFRGFEFSAIETDRETLMTRKFSVKRTLTKKKKKKMVAPSTLCNATDRSRYQDFPTFDHFFFKKKPKT